MARILIAWELVAKSVVQLGAGVVCAPTDDEKNLNRSLRAFE